MENQTPAGQEPANRISDMMKKLNFKMSRRDIILTIVILVILGGAFAYKGLFVAATVNNMPISRLSVIQELEKNSGQQALDIIITKKLIEAEATKAKVTVSQTDIDAEIKKIEDQVSKQGGTLEMALAQQGITEEQLREQLDLQKKMEKILEEKIRITDEEVSQYLAQSQTDIPNGVSDEDFKNQIREQLKGQKFNAEADKWITGIRAAAKIQYFVDYGKLAPAPIEAPVSSQDQ